MEHWHEVEDWLRGSAHDDVVACGAIRPTLVAFAGPRPLLIARWRSFQPGDGHLALAELLTVTTPLGADRLAAAIGGTIRPLDRLAPPPGAGDPLASPLEADGGPRDALVIAMAECGARNGPRCTLTPYERSAGGVQWGLPDVTEAVAGWLPQMLQTAVQDSTTSRPSTGDVAALALRCLVLGHELRVRDHAANALGAAARVPVPRSGSAASVRPRPGN
ncbi:MAG TPA: hypothetical protein VK891_15455 [Euzebyales bacterium]|nr:hypothetical protein [Euzebyales bacterium]